MISAKSLHSGCTGLRMSTPMSMYSSIMSPTRPSQCMKTNRSGLISLAARMIARVGSLRKVR